MKYCFLIMFFWLLRLNAQSLEPTALTATGGYYADSQIIVSHSTGQGQTIPTINSDDIILTQGFQQYYDHITGILDQEMNMYVEMVVYPNPSSDILLFGMDSDSKGLLKLSLYAIDGKEIGMVYSGTYTGNRFVHPISVTHLPVGLYFLQAIFEPYDQEKIHAQTIEFIKNL